MHGPKQMEPRSKVVGPLGSRTLWRKCVTGCGPQGFLAWPHFLSAALCFCGQCYSHLQFLAVEKLGPLVFSQIMFWYLDLLPHCWFDLFQFFWLTYKGIHFLLTVFVRLVRLKTLLTTYSSKISTGEAEAGGLATGLRPVRATDRDLGQKYNKFRTDLIQDPAIERPLGSTATPLPSSPDP